MHVFLVQQITFKNCFQMMTVHVWLDRNLNSAYLLSANNDTNLPCLHVMMGIV